LGTRAILLYLEEFKRKVEHVFLVAPLSNSTKNANRRGGGTYPDFFEHKINLDEIKKLSKNWTILHSTDDHSLKYEEHGVSLSKEMNIEILTYENRKHFSGKDNAQTIFNVLKQKLNI